MYLYKLIIERCLPDRFLEDAFDSFSLCQFHRVVDVVDQEVGDQPVVVIRKWKERANLKQKKIDLFIVKRCFNLICVLLKSQYTNSR